MQTPAAKARVTSRNEAFPPPQVVLSGCALGGPSVDVIQSVGEGVLGVPSCACTAPELPTSMVDVKPLSRMGLSGSSGQGRGVAMARPPSLPYTYTQHLQEPPKGPLSHSVVIYVK